MTQEAWQAFGIELDPVDGALGAVPWCAQIEIQGPLGARINISAERSLVVQATRHILRSADAEVPEELSQDTLREIANILGGTIKGCFEETHTLSLPVIHTDGADPEGRLFQVKLEGEAGAAQLCVFRST